ncbi:MAG TPA: substrate-binding domain-containing protein [Gemmatimonadaceae bacterium]|nr:substrate-binding domain-containing protein [Gemmatimonadaceae bacterium]
MSSRFPDVVRRSSRVAVIGLALIAGTTVGCERARAATKLSELRVCSDPNNLPFSNQQQQGFENKIAQLVAHDLNSRLSYTWWAQHRGFVRNSLNANQCDLLIGVPASFERTINTIPYYRSTYVFVTRHDKHLNIRSFDDPALRRLTIGVQMIGDDFTNTPPAHALTQRHMIQNVRGYSVYGDYRRPNPPARIIDAVANGDIDVAVAWGPLAGYFAQKEPVALDITPVSPQIDLPFLPFVFDISMGVRRGDTALRERLNTVIARRKGDIDRILEQYGVPRVDASQESATP